MDNYQVGERLFYKEDEVVLHVEVVKNSSNDKQVGYVLKVLDILSRPYIPAPNDAYGRICKLILDQRMDAFKHGDEFDCFQMRDRDIDVWGLSSTKPQYNNLEICIDTEDGLPLGVPSRDVSDKVLVDN